MPIVGVSISIQVKNWCTRNQYQALGTVRCIGCIYLLILYAEGVACMIADRTHNQYSRLDIPIKASLVFFIQKIDKLR